METVPPEPNVALTVNGGLDIQNVERLRIALLERLECPTPLVLDLAGMHTCDTAGLQLLCALRRSASIRGRDLRLAHPPTAFFEACERIGLSPKELGL